MSGTTQRLANSFPLWSRVRIDPSSMGQRLFSGIAPGLDYLQAEAVRLSEDSKLLKQSLGIGEVYMVQLAEDDELAVTLSSSGQRTYTAPTLVVGTKDSVDYTLVEDEDLQDITWGIPHRFVQESAQAITSLVVWERSSPYVYNDIDLPGRLVVWVENSTEYRIRGLLKNREASGRTIVAIKGDDINGIPVEEIVAIPDDGKHFTLHLYSRVTEVSVDGFDGDVTIFCGDQQLGVTDPYRVLVFPEMEGPMMLSMAQETLIDPETVLTMYTKPLRNGYEYRNGGPVTDNEEILAIPVLRNSSGLAIAGVDMMVCPDNLHLYVVDSAGRIHIYDHKVPPFSPPETEQTVENYITVIPAGYYAKLGQSEPLWTWFRQPKAKIVSVEIKRVSPSGVVRYLQSDKTWDVASYLFRGTEGRLPEQTWQDLKFETEYDELGQWDYICTVNTILADGPTISQVSVMVPYLDAVATIETGIGFPEGIWFNHNGFVVVANLANAYELSGHRDSYYLDGDNGVLITRENYDSVEVTI